MDVAYFECLSAFWLLLVRYTVCIATGN